MRCRTRNGYRIRVIKLIALLFCVPALAADFFPVSVWYGGGKARAPMLEKDPRAKKELWRKDIRQIKALGFNTVRTWIDWATGEPREHEYRFDNLDVVLELAQDEGLKVFLQVYMDSAPRWIGEKYPDSFFVSSYWRGGDSRVRAGILHGPSGVRQADLAFYAALAEHVRRSPAFVGWDLWSEPHVINWANPTYIPDPEFCFCKNTVAKFRKWLQQKYADLDKLNTAWYRHYESWDQVEPGRMSTILSYTDYIDWKTFIADKLGDDLHDRYLAVKQTAPDQIVTSHAAAVGLFTSPRHWEGQPDDWIMARQVDYYGTSFYPKHSAFVDRDVPWRAALLDFTRSFGFADGRPGFYVGELQGGFGTIALNVSPTVTPEDIRVWTWTALSRGAKGVSFYAWYPMSSGYESGGFGLIELDGTDHRARPRSRFDCTSGGPQPEAVSGGAPAPHTSRDRLQSALPFHRRPGARHGLRRSPGRIDRHRDGLVDGRVPRAFSAQRAGGLCPHSRVVRGRAEAIQAGDPALSADAAAIVRRAPGRVRAAGRNAGGGGATGLEQRERRGIRTDSGHGALGNDGMPRGGHPDRRGRPYHAAMDG